MNELTSLNTNYHITEQGDAYITQAQAAIELGVTYDAIKSYGRRNGLTYTELPVNGKQIKHLGVVEYAALISHYANSGNKQAILLATKIMQAGMVVYIYGSAGVTLPSQRDPVLEEQQKVTIAELKAKVARIELSVQRSMKGRLISLSKLINEEGLNTTVPKLTSLLMEYKLLYGSTAKGYRVTRKGKPYGDNFPVGAVTQPRWFEDSFNALLDHINYKD